MGTVENGRAAPNAKLAEGGKGLDQMAPGCLGWLEDYSLEESSGARE